MSQTCGMSVKCHDGTFCADAEYRSPCVLESGHKGPCLPAEGSVVVELKYHYKTITQEDLDNAQRHQ